METQSGWFRIGAVALVLGAVGCGEVERGANGSETSTTLRSSEDAGSKDPGAASMIVGNRFGFSRTVTSDGSPLKDPENPFFQSLGANGRSCSSCHVPESGMSVTPEFARERFAQTEGLDPLFRTVDGSSSPLADVSTVDARRTAYGLLLDRALIRVGIGVPANAEFELVSVEDPYGFASAKELSLFRRPLATTNLRFLSTVMWDGRETFKDPSSQNGFAGIHFDLAHQASDATTGHAQAAREPTAAEQQAIVSFEMQIHTAQSWDRRAGRLDADDARGGRAPLRQRSSTGESTTRWAQIPRGRPFDPTVFTLYRRVAVVRDKGGRHMRPPGRRLPADRRCSTTSRSPSSASPD